MKIVETLTPTNAQKTFMGDKHITFTLDTETEELVIKTPAMFTNPTTTLNELRNTLDRLAEQAAPR